jgi:hypothetical protein
MEGGGWIEEPKGEREGGWQRERDGWEEGVVGVGRWGEEGA